jgi:hypothetical protein
MPWSVVAPFTGLEPSGTHVGHKRAAPGSYLLLSAILAVELRFGQIASLRRQAW